MAKGNTTPLSSTMSMDTTDFKTGINSANRELRVLESGFKANVASMGNWSKTSEGLEARLDTLGKKMEVQKGKVEATRAEYERMAAEKGANSIAAKELEIQLNDETASLGKMEFELKRTETSLKEMGDETSKAGEKTEDLGKKQDETKKKTNTLKSALNGLKDVAAGVGKALAAIGAAALGAIAGIGALVLKATDAAGELVDLSNKTGFSTTQLQEMKYVGDQLGVSLETMTGSLSKLTRNMASADDKNDVGKAFATLGVNVRDGNGALRDSRTVYQEALQALGSMTNETERDALAMQLFGKSAMELNPLIKAGSQEINQLTAEAHKMGAVMSEADVSALESFGDELAGLKSGLQGNLGTIAAAILPSFKELTSGAKSYMQQLAMILSGSGGNLSSIGPQLGQLLGQIFQDMANKLPDMLELGLGVIQGLVGAISRSLPGLATAGVEIIRSLVEFLKTSFPLLIDAAVSMIKILGEGLISMLPDIVDAAVAIVLALAGGLISMLPMLVDGAMKLIIALLDGMTKALPKLIEMIVTIIPLIVETLMDNLPLLVEASLQLIIALATGLVEAIPTLLAEVPKMIESIVEAIVKSLPLIGEAAVELVMALLKGIIGALPELGKAAIEIIKTVVEGIGDLWEKITEVGANILKGILKGIIDNGAQFFKDIKDFFGGIVDSVKDLLGIRSPSTVFAGIGKNMALGLGSGFTNAFGDVKRDLNGMIDGFSSNIAVSGLAYAGAGAMGRSTQIEAPIGPIYVNSPIDVEALTAKVARKIKGI